MLNKKEKLNYDESNTIAKIKHTDLFLNKVYSKVL